ncbi:uncharacterized protein BCR38DRAFT_491923 [Pseudomassariella vexata]|uniref:Uncharacterized protein n=1 Tax=Pseudomassariella vexata TaxID=1141098 RepID=A0A1Y2EHK7_9PEZI|nr:uncharacterized protein BCR38DRAFT_491923 [Pseudomassariella vexata]ORY71051.1 hypothetical protein BCR38DRAFT_491923 [Pseudomassariella vexata]
MTLAAQSLFDYSVQVGDSRYDPSFNYIWYQDRGQLNTRFTAWYIPGLLYRAEGDDIERGIAAIESVLDTQYTKNYEAAWYGTFKDAADIPDPKPGLYEPEIFESYDPNWREFIGTQLVQVVEEFSCLLSKDLILRIEDAVEAAAVGGMRRNGTFPKDDNLTSEYSNIAIMRALNVGCIGTRRNNQTLIEFARQSGNDIMALFQREGQNVLGEYNAPNYYGIVNWALAANIAYGPADAPMTLGAPLIIRELWKDIAAHYNPFLGNMAGPYDRAYTRDATTHSAIISLTWWGVFGREYGPQPLRGEPDLLYDVVQGAAIALVVNHIAENIDDDTASVLKAKGCAGLMIGAYTVKTDKGWGDQFVPAIVHWASEPEHSTYPYNGFFSLYPTTTAIEAVAGPSSLTISYPDSTAEGADIFTFALSGIPPSWTLPSKKGNMITGFDNLPCLGVNVSAPGLLQLEVVYGVQLRDHFIYNISYAVPANFSGTPQIEFELKHTC